MREHADLYAVLEIPATASPAEVRHAYRAELRRLHPDTRDPDPERDHATADNALGRVLAAYAVLNDPQRRADYDRRPRVHPIPATAWPRPPVVVLGDAGPTWSHHHTGITPLLAEPPPPSHYWIGQLLRALAQEPW
jgi:curved DNA-binding protein CbpA